MCIAGGRLIATFALIPTFARRLAEIATAGIGSLAFIAKRDGME
jgi:hypothetical protein